MVCKLLQVHGRRCRNRGLLSPVAKPQTIVRPHAACEGIDWSSAIKKTSCSPGGTAASNTYEYVFWLRVSAFTTKERTEFFLPLLFSESFEVPTYFEGACSHTQITCEARKLRGLLGNLLCF
jgi:hypothetical protein